MGLLKKENWIINLVMCIFTLGGYIVIPASLLNLYEKDEWYSNLKYWICGLIMLVFPVIIMLFVLAIQMTVKIAKLCKIDGENIYGNVYVWIILLIIPIIGWILFIVMYLYLHFFIILKIKDGALEK